MSVSYFFPEGVIKNPSTLFSILLTEIFPDLKGDKFVVLSLIENLMVYPDNMKDNLTKFYGLVNSQRVMLALTQKGVSRENAYEIVQRCAMKSWNKKVDN